MAATCSASDGGVGVQPLTGPSLTSPSSPSGWVLWGASSPSPPPPLAPQATGPLECVTPAGCVASALHAIVTTAGLRDACAESGVDSGAAWQLAAFH
eukprot:6118093-Prymnesium_polylepis.1